MEEPWDGKARFALRMMVDAMAPTNFLAGNPAASSGRSTPAASAWSGAPATSSPT